MSGDVTITVLEPTDCADAALVDELTVLVNDVYTVAENGLWTHGATRTTPCELARLIGARQIAVARCDGRIAGCVHVHDVAGDATEFGLLAAHPDVRGQGIGRALVEFAEQDARHRGRRAMQLELLVPRAFS